MIFTQRTTSNILNRNLTCFLVARVDSGGIDNNQDALISYGNVGNGKWELRSLSTSVFNSKLAKNSTWMPTVNYSTPLDTSICSLSILILIHQSHRCGLMELWLMHPFRTRWAWLKNRKLRLWVTVPILLKPSVVKWAKLFFLELSIPLYAIKSKVIWPIVSINNSLPFTHPHRYIRPKAKVPLQA